MKGCKGNNIYKGESCNWNKRLARLCVTNNVHFPGSAMINPDRAAFAACQRFFHDGVQIVLPVGNRSQQHWQADTCDHFDAAVRCKEVAAV